MGKKGSSTTGSWLTAAVKRAFRSPSKDHPNKNTNSDDDKLILQKKDRRRWLFRKTPTQESPQKQHPNAEDEQRHAIAVAVATAAAEAAVATAQAAMEVARLTTTTTAAVTYTRRSAREDYAAVLIQTAFRGYLARRALRALKGLVKLQALVRGHNVRKQAKMTLKCMQALVRVQSRLLDQRVRVHPRKSTFSDSCFVQDLAERRSVSHLREASSGGNEWDERHQTVEEVKAMLQSRREAAAFKREKSLSQAFSEQMWRSDRSSIGGEEELDQDKPRWLDRWMTARQWEGRASVDRCRSEAAIKTVEMDTSSQLPYNYPHPPPRRSNAYSNAPSHQHYQRPASPIHHRAHSHSSNLHQHQQSPVTPSPSRSRPIQVRSASPRCIREERGFSVSSQTPSLRSNYHYTGNLQAHSRGGGGISMASYGGSIPNYMVATESAKARIRSQSAPRQRAMTPERERGGGSVKKRLSYPVPPCPDTYSLRSPSFKSVSGVALGYGEQQSIYSSCYTDSLAGGEVSPSSTSDMRRWLR